MPAPWKTSSITAATQMLITIFTEQQFTLEGKNNIATEENINCDIKKIVSFNAS